LKPDRRHTVDDRDAFQRDASAAHCSHEQQFREIAELQRHLLPRDLPQLPGWRFAVHYSIGPQPSGDYYDFLRLPDGRLVFVVADASGHGGLAAVMMTLLRVTLHTCPLTSGCDRAPFCPLLGAPVQPPYIVLGHVNRVLHENSLDGQFMTAFYAALDPANGIVQFASAGHPTPRWWRRATGRVVSFPDVNGLPLGLERDVTYQQACATIEPGDLLACYTDGLIEAMNGSGELFGLERLDAAIRDSAGRDAEDVKTGVLDRLDKFLAGNSALDDITLVLLQRLP
jgi:sigma-B regulation protein RsbU (phosphoserine phosphatase)